LICPFDSFMWHRKRIKDLFGFDYKIEVYVLRPSVSMGIIAADPS